jgi:hypothetical protein
MPMSPTTSTDPDLNEDGVRLGDVYVMDADGTNKTNLTKTPRLPREPTVAGAIGCSAHLP